MGARAARSYLDGMTKPSADVAGLPSRMDFEVPDGCPLCGWLVHLRLTEGGAIAVCVPCEYVGMPEVTNVGPGKYELSYPASAEA